MKGLYLSNNYEWHGLCTARLVKYNAMLKKILIVEDNELLIEVMTYILISNGYEVIALSRGDDVFNHIKTTHPDLVILDAILPGMDGRDICQLIKLNKATKDLPVIICSGDDSIGESLRQKGAPDDVLQKPFDITALIEKVEYQLAA
ncbi:response regulator [soil metagenome]|jgi:DNA-binding response OmpR family regulator